MSFNVAAESYARFMGRFSEPLAAPFAAAAGVGAGDRVVDVGCGPGALTAELVRLAGAGAVSAIDPSAPFVAAVRERFPGLDVRSGSAEHLPFTDDAFDAALAQLVVHFMTDPVAGLREMARVTRPGGTVAACVWDHEGGAGPLSTFWQAVTDLDPHAETESRLAGTREGQLAELCDQAGLSDVEDSALRVEVSFASVDDWWEPYTLGVGPAGSHVAALDADAAARLRARCAELLPAPPFVVTAVAWCAVGRVR